MKFFASIGRTLMPIVAASALVATAAVQAPTPVAGGVAGASELVAVMSSTTLSVRATPTITGTVKVGSPLRIKSNGSYSAAPTSYSFQWYRSGKPIAGATKSSYRLQPGDYQRMVKAVVTASRDGFTPAQASTRSYRVAVGNTVKLKNRTPKPGGTLKPGSTLTAGVPSTYVLASRYTYQWKLSGKSVKGATRRTFTLPRNAAGRTVAVSVRVSSTGYRTSTWSTSRSYRIGVSASSGAGGEAPNTAGGYDPTKDSRFQLFSTADVERYLFAAVNRYHAAANGGKLLPVDPIAEMEARNLAEDMLRVQTVHHDNWPAGGQNAAGSAWCWIQASSAKELGEFWAKAWMNSPGHRRAIEDPRSVAMGVGVAQNSEGDCYAALNTTFYPQWSVPRSQWATLS